MKQFKKDSRSQVLLLTYTCLLNTLLLAANVVVNEYFPGQHLIRVLIWPIFIANGAIVYAVLRQENFHANNSQTEVPPTRTSRLK